MLKKSMQCSRTILFILISLLFWAASAPTHSLPKEVRADQYLLEAQEAYRNGKHGQAVEAFGLIEDLDVSMPAEFHYFYGLSLMESGNYLKSLEQLSRYLELEGRSGRHYQDALRAYGEAEQKAERAEFLKKQKAATSEIRKLQQHIEREIDQSDFRDSGKAPWGVAREREVMTMNEASASASSDRLCVIDINSRIKTRNRLLSSTADPYSGTVKTCYSDRKTIDFTKQIRREFEGTAFREHERLPKRCHGFDGNSVVLFMYEEANESDGIAIAFEGYDAIDRAFDPDLDPIRKFQELCSSLPKKWLID